MKNKDIKLYKITADYRKDNPKKPQYYVWGRTKKEAKDRFNNLISCLKIYDVEVCDDSVVIKITAEPLKHIIIWIIVIKNLTERNDILNKQIFIINGSGGVGKSTFCRMVEESLPLFVDKFDGVRIMPVKTISSVDQIKEIAEFVGWNAKFKTEKDRKFLSDLKDLCSEYSDFSFNYMAIQVESFRESNKYVLFIHSREPKEIERVKQAFDAKTILIKRDNVKHITSNKSDREVFDYDYDIVINNNGSKDELLDIAKEFCEDLLNNEIKSEYQSKEVTIEWK